MNRWASILLWESTGTSPERAVHHSATEELTVVFASDIEQAAEIAAELAQAGVELIELCGGFGTAGAARIKQAVGQRAAVGTVMFGIESLTEAAAYKAKFEQA